MGCRLFSSNESGSQVDEIPKMSVTAAETSPPVVPVRDWRRDDEMALNRECPPIAGICAKAESAVFCQVRSYKNRVLHFHDQLSVHADSACAARIEIYKNACQARMVPSELGIMQCVPDGSSGNCPELEEQCASEQDTATEVTYTICFADKYGNQTVKRSPGLFGRGTNECGARANLRANTCKNNLNPELLTEVSCVVDETAGECLNLKHICRDERKKTFCRVTLSKGSVPEMDFRGEGESRCEAMMAIHREACSRHVKPSALDQIVCYFEK